MRFWSKATIFESKCTPDSNFDLSWRRLERGPLFYEMKRKTEISRVDAIWPTRSTT
jgi:hypothetical protein